MGADIKLPLHVIPRWQVADKPGLVLGKVHIELLLPLSQVNLGRPAEVDDSENHGKTTNPVNDTEHDLNKVKEGDPLDNVEDNNDYAQVADEAANKHAKEPVVRFFTCSKTRLHGNLVDDSLHGLFSSGVAD